MLCEESGSPLRGGWGNNDDNGYGGGSLEEPEGQLRLDFALIRVAPFGACLEWWALDGAAIRTVPQTQFFFSQKYRAIFGDILGNVLRK